MDDRLSKDAGIRALVAAALEGSLTDAQAEELAACGDALLKMVLLAAARRIAELKAKIEGPARMDPSTPSGQRPIHTKPPAPKRKGQPGAKPGHVGSRRPVPPRIDRREEHRAEVCPDCGGELQRCKRTRTRTVEGRDQDHQPRWHSSGASGRARGPWRTSWPTCGRRIDRSRGGPALAKFFTEAFDGVLVHDFWAAYDAIEAQDHQCCLAHLLRELEKVDLTNGSAAWKAFAKKLRRLVRDGMRLRKRADFDPARYGNLIRRIDGRLMELARGTYGDADAERLAKRLMRHCDSLFTFLDHPDVPYENNHAERMIRPAVIIRKNSQSNRSDKGAMTQATLMSLYRTLKLRGRDPVETVADALRTYAATGQLPPLPVESVADG